MPDSTTLVWANSKASNGSLLVLLAIADECGEEEFTDMSVAELSRKTRLSDKGVRRAVKDLQALGELSVEPRPGGTSRYALCLTPVKTTGPTPVILTGVPVKTTKPSLSSFDRTTPVKMTGPPEDAQVSGETPVKMTGPQEISDERSTSLGGRRSKPSSPEAAPRPDVERLCGHLAARIEGNGARRPNITKKWRDAARLMIDKDGRTERQVHNMIDWCQADEFWRSNILSMPTLRDKYDQLKLKAMQEVGSQSRPQPQPEYPARPAASRMPKWCGDCNERTRFTDEEPPRRCPRCHPAYAAGSYLNDPGIHLLALRGIRAPRRRMRPRAREEPAGTERADIAPRRKMAAIRDHASPENSLDSRRKQPLRQGEKEKSK